MVNDLHLHRDHFVAEVLLKIGISSQASGESRETYSDHPRYKVFRALLFNLTTRNAVNSG
jgi:hypothetical protein